MFPNLSLNGLMATKWNNRIIDNILKTKLKNLAINLIYPEISRDSFTYKSLIYFGKGSKKNSFIIDLTRYSYFCILNH